MQGIARLVLLFSQTPPLSAMLGCSDTGPTNGSTTPRQLCHITKPKHKPRIFVPDSTVRRRYPRPVNESQPIPPVSIQGRFRLLRLVTLTVTIFGVLWLGMVFLFPQPDLARAARQAAELQVPLQGRRQG